MAHSVHRYVVGIGPILTSHVIESLENIGYLSLGELRAPFIEPSLTAILGSDNCESRFGQLAAKSSEASGDALEAAMVQDHHGIRRIPFGFEPLEMETES